MFSEGREDVNDEERAGRPSMSTTNENKIVQFFIDCRGVVRHEFLPQGRTINKEYYLQVMRKLCKAIRQKRPDLLVRGFWPKTTH